MRSGDIRVQRTVESTANMTYILSMNPARPFSQDIHHGGSSGPVMLAALFVFAALFVLLASAAQAQPCPSPDAVGPYDAGWRSVTVQRGSRTMNCRLYYPASTAGQNTPVLTGGSMAPFPMVAFRTCSKKSFASFSLTPVEWSVRSALKIRWMNCPIRKQTEQFSIACHQWETK